MIYNEFQGLKLSRLGFGCMRFTKDPATGEIDQEKVEAMFDRAIAAGVNYFDTAYPYLDGKSEIAMAKALRKYPRESYYIADKFPGHSLPGPVDNVALFNLSLKKCETDYFDFYLLHNITESTIGIYESPEYHILPDILKLKEEGRIRHLGFSCHGGTELLEYVLSKYEGVFEFVQIQCNYLDWTMQHAEEKYDLITKHGLGVWVMEPCRGGRLAEMEEETLRQLRGGEGNGSPASYAFRFLQDKPNIKMILSGMTEVEQVEDNLRTFETYQPLTARENELLLNYAETLKQGVPCTGCRYCCAGCPMELNIPSLMECYNNLKFGNGMQFTMRIDALPEEKRPAACVACGQCAEACPQGIDVPAVLAELVELYNKGPKWADAVKSRHADIRAALHMD